MAEHRALVLFLVTSTLLAGVEIGLAMSMADYVTAIVNLGMRRVSLRLALKSWNQFNEVGNETPHTRSTDTLPEIERIQRAFRRFLHTNQITRITKLHGKVQAERNQGREGPGSQLYLLDIGSCWKNDGRPCNGELTSDVTRYSEMIVNPDTPAWCRPDSLRVCQPYYTFPNGTSVLRNDTARFPYSAYHLYCSPGNAQFPEAPYGPCDPHSNPQPQEILQILPHPVWGDYGCPTSRRQGWIDQPRTWKLDTGRLPQSIYFYQDPGTPAAKRQWMSVDVGTEIFNQAGQVAEWTVSDFDILITQERQ